MFKLSKAIKMRREEREMESERNYTSYHPSVEIVDSQLKTERKEEKGDKRRRGIDKTREWKMSRG